MLLTKYRQYILNVEIKSETDFKILQHPGVKNLECLTVSLPLAESEPEALYLFVRFISENIRK